MPSNKFSHKNNNTESAFQFLTTSSPKGYKHWPVNQKSKNAPSKDRTSAPICATPVATSNGAYTEVRLEASLGFLSKQKVIQAVPKQSNPVSRYIQFGTAVTVEIKSSLSYRQFRNEKTVQEKFDDNNENFKKDIAYSNRAFQDTDSVSLENEIKALKKKAEEEQLKTQLETQRLVKVVQDLHTELNNDNKSNELTFNQAKTRKVEEINAKLTKDLVDLNQDNLILEAYIKDLKQKTEDEILKKQIEIQTLIKETQDTNIKIALRYNNGDESQRTLILQDEMETHSLKTILVEKKKSLASNV